MKNKRPPNDKIFNNTYNTGSYNTAPISFNKDSFFDDADLGSQVNVEMIYSRLDESLIACDWAKEILERDMPSKTVSKKELNSLFKYLYESINKMCGTEVFSYILQWMELDPSKFYDMLSNSIKDILIAELKERGSLNDRGLISL